MEAFLRKYLEEQRENRAANASDRLRDELKWSTESKTAEEKVDILFRQAQRIIMGPLPDNIFQKKGIFQLVVDALSTQYRMSAYCLEKNIETNTKHWVI